MGSRTVRTLTAVVTVTALAAGGAACSAPDDGDGGSRDALTVGVAQEPDTLSPLLGYGKDGNSKIFDGLLRRDAKMNLKPALATKLPDVSGDGRTYTFTLREGVQFSDGSPFTAQDVVFTYETILDKKTNNPNRGELDAVESVQTKGKHTVVFQLKYPYAAFAERTVLPIASREIAGKQDVNDGAYNTKPVGTGPYVLTNWRKGEKLSFKANPDYWGGAPEVQRFTMAIVEDDDVRATRLRSGDLDGALLPPQLAQTFEEDEDKRTVTAKSADFRAVTLPSGNDVTGDTAVRRALDRVVDRSAMVRSILSGAGKPAYGPVPTDSEWFAKDTRRSHDLKGAKEILDEAGWKSDEGGVRSKDGRRAEFTLWYPAGDQVRQEHALAYADDAKKAGIKVNVKSGSWEVIDPRLEKDAVLSGGGSPADPDFDLYSLLHSELALDGYKNMAAYDNPTVDKALEKGRHSGDRDERAQAYRTVQRELAKDPGYTFLTHIDHTYVVNDRWSHVSTQVEPHDHGLGFGPWWNVENWRPKE